LDKAHLDTLKVEFRSAVLTSALVNDFAKSPLPLAKMTPARDLLYDLMDSAYDAPRFTTYSRRLGHVADSSIPIRVGERNSLAPAEAQRFKQRSSSDESTACSRSVRRTIVRVRARKR